MWNPHNDCTVVYCFTIHGNIFRFTVKYHCSCRCSLVVIIVLLCAYLPPRAGLFLFFFTFIIVFVLFFNFFFSIHFCHYADHKTLEFPFNTSAKHHHRDDCSTTFCVRGSCALLSDRKPFVCAYGL